LLNNILIQLKEFKFNNKPVNEDDYYDCISNLENTNISKEEKEMEWLTLDLVLYWFHKF